MTEREEQEAHNRAKARWRILRQAILGEPSSTASQEVSIHRFRGFQMLQRTLVKGCDDSHIHWRRLKRVICFQSSSCSNLLDEVFQKLQACQDCCLLKNLHVQVTLEINFLTEADAKNFVRSFLQRLADNGYNLQREPTYALPESGSYKAQYFACVCRFLPSEPTAEYECVEYAASCDTDHIFPVQTRERVQSSNRRVDLKALTSQRHYGVDNTGNACVWDSECTLTYVLVSALCEDSKVFSSVRYRNLIQFAKQSKDFRVVELGAGMAGVAGLTLGAMKMSGLFQGMDVDVVLTDGHPDAVHNNLVNAQLTSALHQTGDESDMIRSLHLLWKESQDGASECGDVTSRRNRLFSLCLASDCLHFEEFHAALMLTIARLLRVDGVAILCQPHRGKSLKKFIKLLECVNQATSSRLWKVSLLEDYDETISSRHRTYAREDPCYDPSIHYPNLLVLRKIRMLDESRDACAALQQMKKRDPQ